MQPGLKTSSRRRERGQRLTDFSCIGPCAALCFVRKCSPVFARLGVIVTREVCSYLWYQPKLLVENFNTLWSLDPVSLRLESELVLSKSPIKSIYTALCFGEHEAFIQAGPKLTSHILRNGELTEIPTIPRFSFGAIFDMPRMRLCFFGGLPADESSRKCQQWLLRTEEWQGLPSMHTGKWLFTPCKFRNKIYMFYNVMEVFDPQRESFSLIPNFLRSNDLRICSPTITVPFQDEIVIISRKAIAYWRPDTQAVTEVFDFECFSLLQTTPVVVGEWIYFDVFRKRDCSAVNARDRSQKTIRVEESESRSARTEATR